MTNDEKTIVPGNEEEVVTPEKPSEDPTPAQEGVTA